MKQNPHLIPPTFASKYQAALRFDASICFGQIQGKESKMTLMTDPMTTSRGILKLISESVSEAYLARAYSTLELGYPRDAILYAIVAARDSGASISGGVRELILTGISWPEDELKDINSTLNDILLLAS